MGFKVNGGHEQEMQIKTLVVFASTYAEHGAVGPTMLIAEDVDVNRGVRVEHEVAAARRGKSGGRQERTYRKRLDRGGV